MAKHAVGMRRQVASACVCIAFVSCALFLEGCGGGGASAIAAYECEGDQIENGCSTCSNKTRCTECKAGYVEALEYGLPECDSCLKKSSCEWPCSLEQSSRGCTKCRDDKYCTECSEGWDSKDGVCEWTCNAQQLASGCTVCEHETKCLECNSGMTLLDDRCVWNCNQNQADNMCTSCNNTGSERCLKCLDGFSIKDDKCVAACIAAGEDDLARHLGKAPEVRNGFAYPAMCVDEAVGKFFIIGDWGGLSGAGDAAPNSGSRYVYNSNGVDKTAQTQVANTMNRWARDKKPRFVVNVGDSFYWGGFEAEGCGGIPEAHFNNWRWREVFEKKYDLPHPTEAGHQIPWFGVLGNHDYGGRQYDSGWDHQVYYTYKPADNNGMASRWRMPGIWWSQMLHFQKFSLELYMMDGNYIDAHHPGVDPNHNICNKHLHHGTCAGPGYQAFHNGLECSRWHHKNWRDQAAWLKDKLSKSKAHWTGLVSHYIPNFDHTEVSGTIKEYGVDILMAGHSHFQVVGKGDVEKGDQRGPLRIISGGGGGITAEGRASANNNMYGFMDCEVTEKTMTVQIITYAGRMRDKVTAERKPKLARGEV